MCAVGYLWCVMCAVDVLHCDAWWKIQTRFVLDFPWRFSQRVGLVIWGVWYLWCVMCGVHGQLMKDERKIHHEIRVGFSKTAIWTRVCLVMWGMCYLWFCNVTQWFTSYNHHKSCYTLWYTQWTISWRMISLIQKQILAIELSELFKMECKLNENDEKTLSPSQCQTGYVSTQILLHWMVREVFNGFLKI